MSSAEVEYATAQLVDAGLPTHPDRVKNWDTYLAVMHAVDHSLACELVIDAGGTRDSVFLRGLQATGNYNLVNINRDEAQIETDGGISYRRGDITNLWKMSDASAQFVACLSVLEHGVDWRVFLREMARIIESGGHLFVSVDYWHKPIDPGGQMAFGAPVKVFATREILDLLKYAKLHDLVLTGDFDLRCREPVVHWLGMDFTFLNLLFRRE